MDRRGFLKAASFGALALTVRRAFGDATLPTATPKPSTDPPDTLDLRAHVARAQARGVPLFVIVVPPAADDRRREAGAAWGELIHHGGDRALPLGRADVVCASQAHVAELGVEMARDTLAVTFAVDGKTQAFGAKLPEYPQQYRRIVVNGKDKGPPEPTEEDIGKQRLQIMGDLVADALGSVGLGQAGPLRAQVKAKLVDRPPPGSHWANASGCGPTRVDETPEEIAERKRKEEEERRLGHHITLGTIAGYGCGMGHVPDQARRFLYFFTRPGGNDSDG